MSLEIELFGQLIANRPRRQIWEITDSVCIREVLQKLDLKEDEVGLITVDGVLSEPEALVHPNSRLCFFPYMSGG
jgi:sulfur carrier protein